MPAYEFKVTWPVSLEDGTVLDQEGLPKTIACSNPEPKYTKEEAEAHLYKVIEHKLNPRTWIKPKKFEFIREMGVVKEEPTTKALAPDPLKK